jgi:5S rRNA maturation endonuclease (ribonuclease M5)
VVKGVIIPTDWDEHGNVIALAISSNDEKEYMVDKKGKGKELLGLIRKEVEVRGVITEEDQKKIIRVTKYSLAEHSEPEGSLSNKPTM